MLRIASLWIIGYISLIDRRDGTNLTLSNKPLISNIETQSQGHLSRIRVHRFWSLCARKVVGHKNHSRLPNLGNPVCGDLDALTAPDMSNLADFVWPLVRRQSNSDDNSLIRVFFGEHNFNYFYGWAIPMKQERVLVISCFINESTSWQR